MLLTSVSMLTTVLVVFVIVTAVTAVFVLEVVGHGAKLSSFHARRGMVFLQHHVLHAHRTTSSVCVMIKTN